MPRNYIGGLMGVTPLAGDPVDLRTSGVFNLGSLGGDAADTVLDADFDSVILLLDGDGTNNQTSFTDLSSVQTPITTFGNAHVDTSVKKFGSGSIEFDGNGDYLRTSDFGLTSGDFTIEAWVQLKAMPTSDSWPAAFSSWMVIVEVGTFNGNDGWQFRIGQTQLAFGTNGDTTAVTGTHGMSTGTWYHLAVTRSGNVYTLYVDGSSVGSATYTAQQPGSGAYGWIGTETGQGAYLNGYIDDLRITKGVARYSNSFTPPTSALTNTVSSGTVVLRLDGDGTNGQTTFTDLSSSSHTITTNGDTQVDTAVKKFGTGSIEFDGTGDYLSISDSEDFNMGSGDFTAECWAYFNSLSTTEPFIMGQWSGDLNAGTLNWAIMLSTNTGYVRFITSSNGNGVLFDLSTSTTSFSLSTSTWYHIAAVRNGSSFKIFVDGVERASTTNTSALYNATNVFTIGAESNGQQQAMNGYLDDIRVTKGAALYPDTGRIGELVPPTSALPTTGTVAGATRPTRKWGGLVGRSLITSGALVKTGNLKLSELLQATYPAPAAPAWSPANITTYAWFDGDDNTTIYTDTGKTTNATNGQDVNLWADKSGNFRDIQKIGTSNVPNYNSSGLNSKGILQSNVSDGLEHQLSTNFTSGDWEVYTVVKVNNVAGGGDNYPRIMAFGAATGPDYNNTSAFIPLYYSNVAGNFQSWQANAGGPTVGGYTNGTFRLISARSDSGTAYISADGGTESTSSKTFTANATGFRLFAPVQAGIGANLGGGLASDAFLDGAIAELVFISGNLSSADKQKLEGYLSHKWGLEGNLPSDHPYKTEAPSS